jgi:hypothetical protein
VRALFPSDNADTIEPASSTLPGLASTAAGLFSSMCYWRPWPALGIAPDNLGTAARDPILDGKPIKPERAAKWPDDARQRALSNHSFDGAWMDAQERRKLLGRQKTRQAIQVRALPAVVVWYQLGYGFCRHVIQWAGMPLPGRVRKLALWLKTRRQANHESLKGGGAR